MRYNGTESSGPKLLVAFMLQDLSTGTCTSFDILYWLISVHFFTITLEGTIFFELWRLTKFDNIDCRSLSSKGKCSNVSMLIKKLAVYLTKDRGAWYFEIFRDINVTENEINILYIGYLWAQLIFRKRTNFLSWSFLWLTFTFTALELACNFYLFNFHSPHGRSVRGCVRNF